MMLDQLTNVEKQTWNIFVKRFALSDRQQKQFLSYVADIIVTSKKFNITAITDFENIIKDHFTDSLALSEKKNLKNFKSFIDVGSGGGFPGIPLKIMYPHFKVTLLEVNQKKVDFLQEMVEKLELEDVTVCDQDWRNFLRTHKEPIDLVIARASLAVPELLRMFKGSSFLKNGMLAYWASKYWHADNKEVKFVLGMNDYHVDKKLRKLVFFKAVGEV